MKQILTIVGTRPQYIKLAPIYHELKKHDDVSLIIIDTGQHYDDELSKFILDNLKIEKIDYNLGIKEIHHGIQTGKMMILLEPIIQQFTIDHCIVFGDTNSTLAGAVVARKLKIPTSHIEAGIRLHDINIPEEINRRVTDSISNYLFVPSQIAFENLKRENVAGEVVFSGDIMFDSIKMFQKDMVKNEKISKIVSASRDYIFMTLHRAENVDDPVKLNNIFMNLDMDIPLIFPCHPRTRKRISENNISIPKNIHIFDPISYLELLYHVSESALVVTDSGGLQKESYYLGKRSIVLYPESPWPELEKLNAIILSSPDDIREKINYWIKKPLDTSSRPYGSGDASKIILDKILSSIK